MQSTDLLHLRHHLNRPEGLSLKCWAEQFDTLTTDTVLLEESLREHRQMRRLDRELKAVRQASPHLEGPALADAVLDHDRCLQWSQKACRAELLCHWRLVHDIAARFDPPKLQWLAIDEFACHALVFHRRCDQVARALARPTGAPDTDLVAALKGDLAAARQGWQGMHDTVHSLLRLLDDIHGEAWAPSLVGWADDRLEELRDLHARLHWLEAAFQCWSRPG